MSETSSFQLTPATVVVHTIAVQVEYMRHGAIGYIIKSAFVSVVEIIELTYR